MQEILHLIKHTFLDSVTILPFLVAAFAVLEILETKFEAKSAHVIEKAGKAGPSMGALFGLVPQCGFSVIGSNFYAKRVITVGTLIAIYLSTSDEALLVMLSAPNHIKDVLIVMAFKFAIAVSAGYIIDLFFRKKAAGDRECHHYHHNENGCRDEELVGEEHCCNHSAWKPIVLCTLKRTCSVFLFLFTVNFLLGWAIEAVGEAKLQEAMLTNSIFQPLLTALIGLIPNCAPSVIMAQMYINGAISLGSVISGLCTGAGAGLIVLFRVNRGVKENLAVVSLLYVIGAGAGMLIELFQKLL